MNERDKEKEKENKSTKSKFELAGKLRAYRDTAKFSDNTAWRNLGRNKTTTQKAPRETRFSGTKEVMLGLT